MPLATFFAFPPQNYCVYQPVGGIKLVEKNDEKVAHIVDF